ncbi:MAG: hypothetical protein A2538_05145 [Candidatus Magasanikbacteria bacterium RIFOXYD2_FULL_41_14]|uniref:Uncharacterized protein n=1 Tax=Candidatus Magasanikbacteria bacterium RIFOXYD2_FULL_41_14 TaxID=1798709 RepID=A0A1F6PFZ8_9BACT|nr:MAG: hypothetical protein A2538_05145 [Candidatus Magasanikbacteria bacterium RIFOXYD2_FULL_41_14]
MLNLNKNPPKAEKRKGDGVVVSASADYHPGIIGRCVWRINPQSLPFVGGQPDERQTLLHLPNGVFGSLVKPNNDLNKTYRNTV